MSKLNGLTILIVDDEPALREALAYDFEEKGCLVLQAGSGHEALGVLKQRKVDIVLSDIRMPNGDGVTLLRAIRQIDPKVPIVALISGFSDYSDNELSAMGASQVFKKPANIDFVMTALESLLEKT